MLFGPNVARVARRRLPLLVAAAAPLLWAGAARAQQATTPPKNAASSSTPSATPAGAVPSSDSSRDDSLIPPTPTAPATQPAASSGPAPSPSSSSGSSSGSAPPPPGTPSGSRSIVLSPMDSQSVSLQGNQRPPGDVNGEIGAKPGDVYSEDWWGHTRPILELHGYFRVRGELFHNFTLGRHDNPASPTSPGLWPQPLDNSYTWANGTPQNVVLCGSQNSNGSLNNCNDQSQASANMRFRMNPELHISDNLRILSEIDALDNVVLGSTPNAYAMTPSSKGGYTTAGYSGYAPLGFYSTTQTPPTAGVNSLQNSINVKRAWAEYMTPVGQLRFGRMPDHWGLGMVHNAGDGIDSDWQSTVDRIMFVSGIKSMDLYFGGSWDFVSTGPTSATPYTVGGGQPYDTCQLCNVAQYSLFVAHRTNPDLQRLHLSRGDLVVNGGLYTQYRSQWVDVAPVAAQSGSGASASATPNTPNTLDSTQENNDLVARRAWALMPDAWVQVLFKKFRFEAEAAGTWGEIGNSPQYALNPNAGDIRQFGLATQTELKAIEDKLHLEFGFGWASGDPWASTLSAGNATSPRYELNGGMGPNSTFGFHPDYRVDLIFFRNILTQVEGAYYFRPSVDYDFLRHPDGQKFGGGAAVIWSRASEFMQAPGHKRDLGIELDLQVYYQAKDGSLNDDPSKLGGFFAMLQYGVFFPLGGLDYTSGQIAASPGVDLNTSAAQTVRLFLGVAY
jgi:uncharacterized protein (TIGR04551 family)